MADSPNPSNEDTQNNDRPARADEGPPQTRESPEGASADRQIAQEPQQSTGQGMGQS
jgi:hypothetical protein